MTQTSTAQANVIDLTGLPEEAVRAVRVIVEAMRQQAAQRQASPSSEEWQRRFDEYMREVASRAGRYPEGFVVDDSRESIYQGRGE